LRSPIPFIPAAWYRDFGRVSLPLFGITLVAIFMNGLLITGGLFLIPDLRSIVEAKSLSSILQAAIGVTGHPGILLSLGLLFITLNACFAGWMVVIVSSRILGAVHLASGRERLHRFLAWIGTGALGSLTLFSIILIGAGVAYGTSRWYIGAVLPIFLVTVLVALLFGLWFLFLPFVVIRERLQGTRALSESRYRARQTYGRLLLLASALVVASLSILFELDGFAPWIRIALLGFLLPLTTSLLATLYGRTQSAPE
jgi:hypothetical protein